MRKTKYFGFLAGTIVAVAFLSIRAKADNDSWGDLGYTHKSPVVEEIPESIDEDAPTLTLNDAPAPNDDISPSMESVTVTRSSSEAMAVELPKSEPALKKRATDISTVQNTYGVVTEERKPVQIYASPFAGMVSSLGNNTSDSTPKYAAGVTAGLLVSTNILLYGSYTYGVEGFSNPRLRYGQGIIPSTSDVFELKSHSFDLGTKFYILGRESRLRPFLGGGGGFTRGSLNYTAQNLQMLNQTPGFYDQDYTFSQLNAFGEAGLEVAITRQIVANASFKLRGVMSSTVPENTTFIDPSKADVGNSLSRTASYLIGAGLGVYF